jgi:hypothetical protein
MRINDAATWPDWGFLRSDNGLQVRVGAADESGALYQSVLEQRGRLQHGFQFVHKDTIPPTPLYPLGHDRKRALGCQRFAVRTIRGKRVK